MKNGKIISISGSTDDNYSYETIIDGVPQGALTTEFIKQMKRIQTESFLTDSDSSKWKYLLNNLSENLFSGDYPQKPHLSSNRSIEEIPFSSIFSSS